MRQFELIAPCHFGMESVVKNEIYEIGYEVTEVTDGRVTFIGDEEAIARANICLRTAERILLKVGSFHAENFEELFQGTMALTWEQYLPRPSTIFLRPGRIIRSGSLFTKMKSLLPSIPPAILCTSAGTAA